MQILTEISKMSSNFLVDETSENLTCHSRENENLRIIYQNFIFREIDIQINICFSKSPDVIHLLKKIKH